MPTNIRHKKFEVNKFEDGLWTDIDYSIEI